LLRPEEAETAEASTEAEESMTDETNKKQEPCVHIPHNEDSMQSVCELCGETIFWDPAQDLWLTREEAQPEFDIRRNNFDPITCTPSGSTIWRDYGDPRRIIVTGKGELPQDVIARDGNDLCGCGCGRPAPENGGLIDGHNALTALDQPTSEPHKNKWQHTKKGNTEYESHNA